MSLFNKKPPAGPPATPNRPSQPAAAPVAPAASPPTSQAGAMPAVNLQGTGWRVQVLTESYLIDGFVPPSDSPIVGQLNITTISTVTLNPAQISPTGLLNVLLPTPPEVTVPKSALYAFIPRDEVSLKSTAMQLPQRAEKVIVYAGPYVIRAAFRITGETPLKSFFSISAAMMVQVTDVEITCMLPGAKLVGYKVPLMALNKNAVQAYHAV